MKPDVYVYILVMAGVTYLLRMLPLVLAKKEITNPFVKSFLYYVPYAVLAAMTFPAIFHAVGENPICGVVAAVAGVVLALCKRGLCTVAAGSAIAAYLTMIIL